MSSRALVLALMGLVLMALPLSGQSTVESPVYGHVGLSFLLGEPVGQFDEHIGLAVGGELSGRVPLDPQGFVSLRADVGIMIYGHESRRVCFEGVGCRVEARLQTDNNIFFGGLGPELALPLGWVRPYVNAMAGFGYFQTSSSLNGTWDDESHFNTENLGDGTFAWGVGGGLRVNVHSGRVPVSLDLGARYLQNGVMEYLTEGDIVDNPDGSITLYPKVSEANLVTYRFGVSIGIPRGQVQDREPVGWGRQR